MTGWYYCPIHEMSRTTFKITNTCAIGIRRCGFIFDKIN